MAMELKGRPVQSSSELTPDWMERHNARVIAFRTALVPVLEAMSERQCREVVAMAKDEGLSMTRIAERIRAPLGGTWTDEHVAAGIAIYQAALLRLDAYDDEFRPRPADCRWGRPRAGSEIFYLTSIFYIFGMDVDEVAWAEEITGRLTSPGKRPRLRNESFNLLPRIS